MMTPTLNPSRKHIQDSGRRQTSLGVLAWELRNVRANRRSRWMLLVAFGFFLFVVWLLWIAKFAGTASFGDSATFAVSVTSPQGVLTILPILTFILALILPFLNADGI